MKYWQFILASLIFPAPLLAQQALPLPEKALHSHYVDSVYRKMSRRKRIAQLFIVPAYSNNSPAFQDSIGALIQKFQPGGIIFFQGGPIRQTSLQNHYQDLLKIKALIAMDGEWGLGMRLDSTLSFPYQMGLGAIGNNGLIRKMAVQIAYDFRRMGMQLNFAPDIDINNNPDNSVINYRSFGEIRDNVADKGLAYITGLQSGHVLSTVKHFPGHGDTNVDSHLALPVLPFTRQRLDSLELYPFRKLIAGGAGAVMIAHMHVPAIDSSEGIPTTLSKAAVEGLLRTDYHFSGLIVTDAMNMLGLAKYYTPAEAAVKALQAGNDLVEMSPDLPAALKAVRKAARRGEISRAELNLRCRKVLAYKEWSGLNSYHQVDTAHLIAELNTTYALSLVQQLSDSTLTLLQADQPVLTGLREAINQPSANKVILSKMKRTALLDLGVTGPTLISDSLKGAVTVFSLPKNGSQQAVDSLKSQLGNYGHLLVAIHDQRLRPGAKVSFSPAMINLVSTLAGAKTTALIFLTNAYVLGQFAGLEKAPVLLLTYQDSRFAEISVLKFLREGLTCSGHLPVSILPVFKAGQGL